MAEYIKFRLTAAKAGVSMALLALVAGIVGERESGAAEIHATPAAASFLNLRGTHGNTRTALIKLEQKALKLDVALAKIERNYLKIRTANSQFLKIRNANAQFLKIDKASTEFLKIDDAAAQFLKIDDANSRFLKIDGTAANAQKVGGIGPDQLIQGRGQVLSNALIATSTDQMLLGDGSVRVLIGLLNASQPSVTLENDTSSSLNFTLVGGSSRSSSIPPNGGQATVTPSASQLDIQIFSSGGGGGAGKVWTTTLSTVSTPGGQQFVGQMLIGLL